MSNKEYKNVTIAGVWPTKNGHFNTMPFDEKASQALKAAFERGGKFLIRKRTEESIAAAKSDNTPPYYLEFVPRQAVEEYEAKNPRNRSNDVL